MGRRLVPFEKVPGIDDCQAVTPTIANEQNARSAGSQDVGRNIPLFDLAYSPSAASTACLVAHYVLDEWFEHEVKPQLRGSATLIRYADDFVSASTNECDAKALFGKLPGRFASYGLTIHATKSRLVRFTRPRPE